MSWKVRDDKSIMNCNLYACRSLRSMSNLLKKESGLQQWHIAMIAFFQQLSTHLFTSHTCQSIMFFIYYSLSSLSFQVIRDITHIEQRKDNPQALQLQTTRNGDPNHPALTSISRYRSLGEDEPKTRRIQLGTRTKQMNQSMIFFCPFSL